MGGVHPGPDLPGAAPPTCSPETQVYGVCLVCVWCVCLSVIGGGCEEEGWLSQSARTSSLFFVLSCLRYCVCNEEGQPNLESNEHLVCLGGVRWLKLPQVGSTQVGVVILWVKFANIEVKDR